LYHAHVFVFVSAKLSIAKESSKNILVAHFEKKEGDKKAKENTFCLFFLKKGFYPEKNVFEA
jgi:hypothetical protein